MVNTAVGLMDTPRPLMDNTIPNLHKYISISADSSFQPASVTSWTAAHFGTHLCVPEDAEGLLSLSTGLQL